VKTERWISIPVHNHHFIDPELFKSNCAGDQSMMRDLINLGLLSVSSAMTEAGNFLENEDWDKLARVLHKLRPVLCYCGIISLTDELLLLEGNAKERKDLPGLSVRMMKMLDTLQQIHDEMKQQLSSLSG
jgi:HPt (histidine-containing phosphotransfer) domain-containing protein